MSDENPFFAPVVVIDPAPALAAAQNLPVQRWYCAAVMLDGEPWTAITLDREAMEVLVAMNESGVEPPEELADCAGRQFHTRPGFPMHWYADSA